MVKHLIEVRFSIRLHSTFKMHLIEGSYKMLSRYFWMICVEMIVYSGCVGLWMEFLDWVGQEVFTVDSNRSRCDIKTDEHLLPTGRSKPLLLHILFSSDQKHIISSSLLMSLNSFGYTRWQRMACWQRRECWGSKVWACCCYTWACPSAWLCCESPFCPGRVTCCCSPHFTSSHFNMSRWVSTSAHYDHQSGLSSFHGKKNTYIFITKMKKKF